MHIIRHPQWGGNLVEQIRVEQANVYGEDGKGFANVISRGFCGLGEKKSRKKYVGYINRPATDTDSVRRYFWYRCGLLKLVMTAEEGEKTFIALLDGHATSRVLSHHLEFRIAPKELARYEDKPVADVWFDGVGKRHGPFHDCHTTRLSCLFATNEQLEQYLVVADHIDTSLMKSHTY